MKMSKLQKHIKKKTPLRCFLIKKKYFEIVFSSIEHTLDIYMFESVIDVVF
jgi:PP-loop superfamily ATP-utilizing enzyme